MRGRVVITACGIGCEDQRARELADAVVRAWPGGAAPELAWSGMDTLFAGPHDAILVVAGESASAHTLLRVTDKARDHHAAMLVVSGVTPEVVRSFEGDGVVSATLDEAPASVARALHALCSRQREVEALVRELRVAESCQRSAHTEVERIHDELNLAAQIQREAMPSRLPEIAGFDFAAIFRPTGYVSGDIYDLCHMTDGTVRFFLADAVGHGVPAALLTMLISRALRAPADSAHFSPAAGLTRLNDDLMRAQNGRVRFATAVCGVLSPGTGRISLASAGHPPAIVFAQGEAKPLDADGPLLGVFSGEQYREMEFDLAPGSTLLCYSDGFETAFPELESPGATRASSVHLDRFAKLPWPGPTGGKLRAAFDLLQLSLDEHSGSLHQVDDITAIAISSLGRSARKVA